MDDQDRIATYLHPRPTRRLGKEWERDGTQAPKSAPRAAKKVAANLRALADPRE